MSKSFTPGPWSATEIQEGKRGAAGQWLIITGSNGSFFTLPHGNERHAANARLIAAAPDLLDVVKRFDTLVRRLEGAEIESSLAIALSEILRKSHEVIIEAVGVEAAMDFIDATANGIT